MGRKRAEQQPGSTILLLDVLAAWEAVEEDHGIKLALTCERKPGTGSGQLQAKFTVKEGTDISAAEMAVEAFWAWPTVHHKTFLGMLLWLIHQVDRDITASRALAQMPLFPGARPL